MKHAATLVAGAQAGPWVELLAAGQTGSVIAETSAGKVRGVTAQDVKIFKGIPYGATTAGRNRFMPPTKPMPWTGTLVALDYGPSAPQGSGNVAPGSPAQSEDCLVLNVFTPALIRRKESPGDGVAARRRLFHGIGLAAHPRRHQPGAHARRGGRDDQPPAERVRLHLPG